MKITITGSLGHISKPLAQELVQKGHNVTVISHNPERQKDIEAMGAMASIGSIDDVAFLTTAFTGADAVYTMIPPSSDQGFTDPTNKNVFIGVMERCNKIMNNYAQAIQQSGIKRVVHLSSIGAHLEKGSGLLILHHNAEAILNRLQNPSEEGRAGVDITFMRPVGFYYNLLGFIPVIKSMGMIASNYGADDMIPWVSPIDIATNIVDEITTTIEGRKVRYVASEQITCNEVASILGAAIGKPDLKWILIPDEQLQSGMEKAGVPESIASGLVEMQASMHKGIMYEDYYLNKPELGKIKLSNYAKEFAAMYNQNA